MKYVFTENHQAEFSIKTMCRVLRVARSGWYACVFAAISPVRASCSGSSVMLLSVRHSLRQSSVMERLVSPRNCLNITSKISLQPVPSGAMGESHPEVQPGQLP